MNTFEKSDITVNCSSIGSLESVEVTKRAVKEENSSYSYATVKILIKLNCYADVQSVKASYVSHRDFVDPQREDTSQTWTLDLDYQSKLVKQGNDLLLLICKKDIMSESHSGIGGAREYTTWIDNFVIDVSGQTLQEDSDQVKVSFDRRDKAEVIAYAFSSRSVPLVGLMYILKLDSLFAVKVVSPSTSSEASYNVYGYMYSGDHYSRWWPASSNASTLGYDHQMSTVPVLSEDGSSTVYEKVQRVTKLEDGKLKYVSNYSTVNSGNPVTFYVDTCFIRVGFLIEGDDEDSYYLSKNPKLPLSCRNTLTDSETAIPHFNALSSEIECISCVSSSIPLFADEDVKKYDLDQTSDGSWLKAGFSRISPFYGYRSEKGPQKWIILSSRAGEKIELPDLSKTLSGMFSQDITLKEHLHFSQESFVSPVYSKADSYDQNGYAEFNGVERLDVLSGSFTVSSNMEAILLADYNVIDIELHWDPGEDSSSTNEVFHLPDSNVLSRSVRDQLDSLYNGKYKRLTVTSGQIEDLKKAFKSVRSSPKLVVVTVLAHGRRHIMHEDNIGEASIVGRSASGGLALFSTNSIDKWMSEDKFKGIDTVVVVSGSCYGGGTVQRGYQYWNKGNYPSEMNLAGKKKSLFYVVVDSASSAGWLNLSSGYSLMTMFLDQKSNVEGSSYKDLAEKMNSMMKKHKSEIYKTVAECYDNVYPLMTSDDGTISYEEDGKTKTFSLVKDDVKRRWKDSYADFYEDLHHNLGERFISLGTDIEHEYPADKYLGTFQDLLGLVYETSSWSTSRLGEKLEVKRIDRIASSLWSRISMLSMSLSDPSEAFNAVMEKSKLGSSSRFFYYLFDNPLEKTVFNEIEMFQLYSPNQDKAEKYRSLLMLKRKIYGHLFICLKKLANYASREDFKEDFPQLFSQQSLFFMLIDRPQAGFIQGNSKAASRRFLSYLDD